MSVRPIPTQEPERWTAVRLALARAKGRGLIVEAKPLVEAMVQVGIRFHPTLVKDFWASLGEA